MFEQDSTATTAYSTPEASRGEREGSEKRGELVKNKEEKR